MPGRNGRSWKWMPLLVVGMFVVELSMGSSSGRGQPGARPARPTPRASPSTTCKGCHDQERNRSYRPDELAAMICRMTEMQFYDKADKHQIAYTQLASERSQKIVSLLGLPHKDATTVDACLSCHALPQVDGARTSAAVLAEGVTCVACHGPYREWFGEHQDAAVLRGFQKPADRTKDSPKDWLDLSRKEKEEQKGMTDLWDPVRRTVICASCHIGNFKEQKVVTHAMYAAGHPPLPGFEPATFSEFEPRHWQYLREKSEPQRDRLKPVDLANLEHAELVAIGGPVLLRESMRLCADQAKASRGTHVNGAWPDFARYDCRGCHHELQSNPKDRSFEAPLAPGRPSEPKWVHALVRIGITALTANDSDAARERARYESLVKSLREAMSAEPFGGGSRMIQAAEQLANWADELVKKGPAGPLVEKRAWTLLAQICDEAATRSLDYDTARQYAWAFRAIYHDLIPSERQKERDAEIESILNELDSTLLAKLSPAREQAPIAGLLDARLGIAAQYDGAATAKLFDRLKAAVARH